MLTKSDKQFILKTINGSVEKSRDEQREERKNELAEVKKEMKNEMMKHQDVVIGRLDNIDQELAVIGGHRDEIVDHDIRISTLEKIHPQNRHSA